MPRVVLRAEKETIGSNSRSVFSGQILAQTAETGGSLSKVRSVSRSAREYSLESGVVQIGEKRWTDLDKWVTRVTN